eukprot:gene2272-1415_t
MPFHLYSTGNFKKKRKKQTKKSIYNNKPKSRSEVWERTTTPKKKKRGGKPLGKHERAVSSSVGDGRVDNPYNLAYPCEVCCTALLLIRVVIFIIPSLDQVLITEEGACLYKVEKYACYMMGNIRNGSNE